MASKKVYFISDQHFGYPNEKESSQREKHFVSWLDFIKKDADCIFLLGDLFDFWFEYDQVVPKGFVRVLSKLLELRDLGIVIHFFVGNHDLWMKGYFSKELDISVYRNPEKFNLQGKSFLIGHGDGLGPGDSGYKFMKKLFLHPFFQWVFKWIHPDIGIRCAKYLSKKNKFLGFEKVKFSRNEDKDSLISYCKDVLKEAHFDYFIFAHRHHPMVFDLNENSKYINTGDWIFHFSYVEFSEGKIELKKYPSP